VFICGLPPQFLADAPRVLVNALDLNALHDFAGVALGLDDAQPEPLLIWMAQETVPSAPLDALTHLLAEAVARDLESPVAIVTLSELGGRIAEKWTGPKIRAVRLAAHASDRRSGAARPHP
jgi:hypothetical protein